VPSQRLLDAIQSLAAIEAPIAARYGEELAAELPAGSTQAELAALDTALAAALAHVDATATRVMRIRLDHALASDSSIEPTTRRVFAQTIVGYADNLGLLETRARDVAARGRAAAPSEVAALVVEAARATLAWRAELRAVVLALAREPEPEPEPAREPTLAELIELD
jgi:hypothetical protein